MTRNPTYWVKCEKCGEQYTPVHDPGHRNPRSVWVMWLEDWYDTVHETRRDGTTCGGSGHVDGYMSVLAIE